jgi:glutamate formiminotransferase
LVCVGARNYLVAYNINLASKNVLAVKTIAGQIREIGGGLRGVKALGLYLQSQDCVQISMNLVEPEVTGPEKVYAKVQALAKGAGMEVKDRELIGVLPALVVQEAQQLSEAIDQKIKLLRTAAEEKKINENS